MKAKVPPRCLASPRTPQPAPIVAAVDQGSAAHGQEHRECPRRVLARGQLGILPGSTVRQLDERSSGGSSWVRTCTFTVTDLDLGPTIHFPPHRRVAVIYPTTELVFM